MVDNLNKVSNDIKKKRVIKDLEATSQEASRLLAGLDAISNNELNNRERGNAQKIKEGTHQPYKYEPNREEFSNSPWNMIGGVFSVFIISLFILIPLINSTNSSSPSESDLRTSTSIPFGKAGYRSGRTGKAEMIGLKLSIKTNSNGHIAYEALWADGYKSSYVFWRTGQAEIFSKNKAGNIVRTNARFKRATNGDCIITTDTNAVTTFPGFTPTLN